MSVQCRTCVLLQDLWGYSQSEISGFLAAGKLPQFHSFHAKTIPSIAATASRRVALLGSIGIAGVRGSSVRETTTRTENYQQLLHSSVFAKRRENHMPKRPRIALKVTDLASSLTFYVDRLGFQL